MGWGSRPSKNPTKYYQKASLYLQQKPKLTHLGIISPQSIDL